MKALYVYMNGHEVGEYLKHKNGMQLFTYNDAWLSRDQAIPLSLSMPLSQKHFKGEVVYNFFDNLLPDHYAIRQRIQSTFSTQTSEAFDLLEAIGKDCIGAISLLSEKGKVDCRQIVSDEMTEQEIARALRAYYETPLGMSLKTDFRISLAGAQEKTGFLKREKKWHRPHAMTPTTHIFKLPIGKIEHSGIDLSKSVENEWLCLKLLKHFGLSVPDSDIERFEDQTVLVVKRFDRQFSKKMDWIIRLPVEDMCQAMGYPGALKYESDGGPGIKHIMSLLQASVQPLQDRAQIMKACFLFWMLGAIDGHAKNFSVFLRPNGRFQLTPLYDVISVYPLISCKQLSSQKIKMAMSLKGKSKYYHWHKLFPSHWLTQASKVNFSESEMQGIMDEVRDKMSTIIETVSSELPRDFPGDIAEPIFKHMMTLAKSRL